MTSDPKRIILGIDSGARFLLKGGRNRQGMSMRLITILLALAIPLGGSAYGQAGQDPGEPDTLRIDSATAFVTGIGIVPITFFNDESLTQVETTLRHVSPEVRIDSFSFADGRVDSETYSNNFLLNADSNIVTLFSLSFATPIPPGQGLLGKLFLSYSQTISPQGVSIDSTIWVVGPILHSTSFRASGSSQSFKPQFIPGYLDILRAPDTFDSVWVADVEAAPGSEVAVDVYAFNERNLAEIALALDYSTTDLTLDSVSFVGTRSEPAPTKIWQPQPSLHKVYTVVKFALAAPLLPGSGPVARLHFTIDPLTPEGLILIDSTTVGIKSRTQFTLTPADGSLSFVPLFDRGGITVTEATDVEDITTDENLPTEYELAQNYPNPFNPMTNIELSLPTAGYVEIDVFNILGRRVRRMVERELPAGIHRVVFDGRDDSGSPLATGVYFYRISAGDFHATRKMLLLK